MIHILLWQLTTLIGLEPLNKELNLFIYIKPIKAYPSSAVIFLAVSHACMEGVLPQHVVVTSSPPKCTMLSGKRPEGCLEGGRRNEEEE